GLMMAGAVLSYFVMGPTIATFGEKLKEPVSPATALISEMDHGGIKANYLRYIGAGAVAAGGILQMGRALPPITAPPPLGPRALPLIIASILSGLRDLRGGTGGGGAAQRTEHDLSMKVVLFGSLGLVAVMMAVPALGLGFSFQGMLGAFMILIFGFLFVTVSS